MKSSKPPIEPTRGRRFSLREVAAISAVEGLVMTKDIESAFAAMEKARLGHAERRAFLAGKYGKGSKHGR